MGTKTEEKDDWPYMCFSGVMAGSCACMSQGKSRPSQTELVFLWAYSMAESRAWTAGFFLEKSLFFHLLRTTPFAASAVHPGWKVVQLTSGPKPWCLCPWCKLWGEMCVLSRADICLVRMWNLNQWCSVRHRPSSRGQRGNYPFGLSWPKTLWVSWARGP